MSPIPFKDILEFAKIKLQEFRNTNFDQIRFESWNWALSIGALILLAFLLWLLFSRNRNARAHSGHPLPPAFREGALVKALRMLPKCIVAAGALFCLLALAKPFLPKAEKLEFFESRERIDLQDVSGSTAWEFANTGKSEAEIARTAHLKFLQMRLKKHDRVSYWLFAAFPYKVEDFMEADETFMFEVDDAPYVISDKDNLYGGNLFGRKINRPPVLAPLEKIRFRHTEGGTDLEEALQAVIRYFDLEGNKKIKKKSLLILTDGATDKYPEDELRALASRHITPYVIFIEPNKLGEPEAHLVNATKLIQQLSNYGGRYFKAEDPDALKKAFDAVDALETTRIDVKRYISTPSVFQRFLFVGLLFIVIGCFAGLIIELVFPEYPS